MNLNSKFRVFFVALFIASFCGAMDNNYLNSEEIAKLAAVEKAKEFEALTAEEKDFVARMNNNIKNIRDFLPEGEEIEKYFYVFKSVTNIEDARIIMIGDYHSHAGTRLWRAGLINKLMKRGDVVLFEGFELGDYIPEFSLQMLSEICASQEYERRGYKDEEYTSLLFRECVRSVNDKICSLRKFFDENILNLHNWPGPTTCCGWDKLGTGGIDYADLIERNTSLVHAMKRFMGHYEPADESIAPTHKVFVDLGNFHLPHYEFAYDMFCELAFNTKFLEEFLKKPDATTEEINNAYYDYFSKKERGSTRIIFEFLKDKNFAVLIPKNSPCDYFEFLPKNAL